MTIYTILSNATTVSTGTAAHVNSAAAINAYFQGPWGSSATVIFETSTDNVTYTTVQTSKLSQELGQRFVSFIQTASVPYVRVSITAINGGTVNANAQPFSSSSGAAANFSDYETPGGTIDGANVTFTLANTPNPAASCVGYVREGGAGTFLPCVYGVDFTLSGATVTMTSAPALGSNLTFSYRF